MMLNIYNAEVCLREGRTLLNNIKDCIDLESARSILYASVTGIQYERFGHNRNLYEDHEKTIVRDCARVIRSLISDKSDRLAGFSVAQALWDIARKKERSDLSEAFYAEMINLFRGLHCSCPPICRSESGAYRGLKGRTAALARSDELDTIWNNIQKVTSRYEDGLSDEAVQRRNERKKHILRITGGTEDDWNNWHWHAKKIIKDPVLLNSVVKLRDFENDAVEKAVSSNLPFGITPYYASLFDDDPEKGRDLAIRAQVIPTDSYVAKMASEGGKRAEVFDFMMEADTSPVDLITRRYPAIAILKPFNTCPQICVYCQRNWEIDQAMAPGAMASRHKMDDALKWIEEHEAIKEVLITGGDPLAMSDRAIESLLERLSRIRHIEIIRIGSRTLLTIPMRITHKFASLLGKYRKPGSLDICLMTHAEHVYEITPEFVAAVDLLKKQGISVYNQHVFTFYVSRRFEASSLRLLLRKCGVDPYYTFAPKGKGETEDYRVPIARILQEQKEEARLLPGTRRTDEPVFNVPGLGKNYLRAIQHRDMISVLPDGSRVYEFHPWEKNILQRDTYVGTDVPVYRYLARLQTIGEDLGDYSSIWYYF